MYDSVESYEYEQSAKVISVKSRLRENVKFWQFELNASNFILNTIKYGYVIPFVAVPPRIILKNNRSSINHKEFVCSAISELVSAGCVREVKVPYIVNPLTVSVNSAGKKRLVLDLRHVNQFVEKQKKLNLRASKRQCFMRKKVSS